MFTFVSPTEPAELRKLGKVAILPEKHGADILIINGKQKIGIQRKEVSDLVASIYDGRLSKEVAQMKSLDMAVLCVEGRPVWTTDREMVHGGSRMTKAQLYSIFLSLQFVHDIKLLFTSSLQDTIDTIQIISKWVTKEEHNSLLVRPKPSAPWSVRTSRDWGLHILQSFPGIGVSLAGRIFDKFNCVPLSWDCTPKEMAEIEGLGNKKVNELFKSLK